VGAFVHKLDGSERYSGAGFDYQATPKNKRSETRRKGQRKAVERSDGRVIIVVVEMNARRVLMRVLMRVLVHMGQRVEVCVDDGRMPLIGVNVLKRRQAERDYERQARLQSDSARQSPMCDRMPGLWGHVRRQR
jgi:hypothetical protein